MEKWKHVREEKRETEWKHIKEGKQRKKERYRR
jgi:hypothetical protein